MNPDERNPPSRLVRLTLPVRDWLLIDATGDNTVSIADQNGDGSTSTQGQAVRQAGWAAAREHPRADQGWEGGPPENEDLSIELPAAAWQFIVDQLRRWDEVDAMVNTRSAIDPEPRGSQVARMLEDHMG
ncbi:hypothetical protein [Arthrobacter nitrophenolicus]|uniref:Uncharacterized protein n=1 Tax=Arthrobacter nitrophenolicus TaxID=683150 RepID=A0A4R5XT34_9MICC|nr:hypothetical protein [Arthrobacter nitrophenolicus]TDL34046.1 hypothetical protein E2R57_16190 [Arthrobacter nitrophenolicus]